MVIIDNLLDKEWRKKAAEKTKTAAKEVMEKVTEHPLIFIAGVSVFHDVTKIICKSIDSGTRRPCRFYDPSSKVYITIRRPMKAEECNRFADLRQRGYSVPDALSVMGLL